jgi:glycerate kinase
LKILVAPNAFKGSLTAEQAADAMARGVRRQLPDAGIVCLPIADGGDGLLAVVKSAFGAETCSRRVTGPLGEPVNAEFIHSADQQLAVIEMASCSGLALLKPEQYNPLLATSTGLGELIAEALELGAGHIIVGIGGSATNDGGMGMADALGVRFLDAQGQRLRGNGQQLAQVERIDLSGLDARLADVRLQIVCDVDNPLLGEHGAVNVFAEQKGADAAMRQQLEQGLSHYADVVQQQLGVDVRKIPGGGAAGGLGAAFKALLGAELSPGAELVLDLLGAAQQLADADLALTAEGQLDEQSLHGKAPASLARLAHRHHVPCLALAGSVSASFESLQAMHFAAAFSICPAPVTLDNAMAHAADYLEQATTQAVAAFLAGARWQSTSTGKAS